MQSKKYLKYQRKNIKEVAEEITKKDFSFSQKQYMAIIKKHIKYD